MAWRGQFRPRTCPQAKHELARRQGFQPADLAENWKRLAGMAGMVAEEILLAETDDIGIIYDNICEHIYCDEASASDLELMNITNIKDFELREEDIADAWGYLVANWSAVKLEAEYLIEEVLRDSAHLVVD
ncbi:MAG: hypothetical protein V4476_24215 [Pseudomonadota bacterium]